jgi:uncharacterized peroxidase-related enzyme
MPRLSADQPGIGAEQRELLDETRRQLGRVPNLYAAMANGPAALRGYLALRAALSAGTLDDRAREQLALLVAQENGCAYCVAAHTMRGARLHDMTGQELQAARHAQDDDPHRAAVLQLARAVLRHRGGVDDELLEHARRAGVTDAEIMEIVGHVALNVFSNYANHVAWPDLDFPPVEMGAQPGVPRRWQHADLVELAAGYRLTDGTGAETDRLTDVRVAFEGGFVHVRRDGDELVQTVSAPAVRRISYREALAV